LCYLLASHSWLIMPEMMPCQHACFQQGFVTACLNPLSPDTLVILMR